MSIGNLFDIDGLRKLISRYLCVKESFEDFREVGDNIRVDNSGILFLESMVNDRGYIVVKDIRSNGTEDFFNNYMKAYKSQYERIEVGRFFDDENDIACVYWKVNNG